MRPPAISLIRFLRYLLAALVITLAGNSGILRGQQKTAPAQEKPKIRAITAFINLDRAQYQQQVADALKMLRRAQTILESRGYQVQTIRIATQPFPEYTAGLTTEQAVAFFKQYDALAAKEKFAASIGPAMVNAGDSDSQANLLAEILSNTKTLNASLVVAGEDGVRWNAVGAAARVMKKLEVTEHSQGNFHFAAIAMVPPLTPFFPAAYHTGFGHQFAIALESRENASIGAAIENLTTQPVGMSGTLTAAATITAAIKDVKVKQTGYSGLMLPILEDTRLAQRWSEGHISIDALLSYSAVCGTGLDTVPLPGDISAEELSLIIGDMASLAFKWHKPLSARLLPVLGKGWGEMTEFDDPFLVNAKVQTLDRK